MAVKNVTQPYEHPIDAAAVNIHMDVYARNGDRLGVVSEVWVYIHPLGYLARSRFALADYGPVRGTMHLLEGADGYIQVSPRQGLKRENDQMLYIPLAAIHDSVPGRTLIVSYTNEECSDIFDRRPDGLEQPR